LIPLVVLEHEGDAVRDEQAEEDDPQVEPRLPLAAEALALLVVGERLGLRRRGVPWLLVHGCSV
jgi:hypothetical protein